VVVTRHGKPLVALVSAADLDQLQATEQEQQPLQGVRHFGESLANQPPTTRQHLGLAAKHEPPG
jgi:PHD/YefM family antitoxin component YafN of YafNO toxin-antitoxin module